MKRNRLIHLAWFALVLVVGVVLWRMWIPELSGYEAPQWDESDRAQDAFRMAQGLRHYTPLEFLHQLFFFQTWGPGFSLLAQAPLFIFGFSAHSLTLIPFLSLVFTCAVFASIVRERAGVATAAALSLFSAFWLLNTPAFAPYFSIFMIDGWSIVGWTGIVIAGSVASSTLLVAGSWLLFAMKFQYYAVIFISFAAYIVIVARKNLIPFAKELLAPTWAKALAALVAIAVIHVAIMKVAGPIYGQPSWDQPRALRNPILYGFLFAVILLFAKREVFFRYLIAREWEARYVKYFLFPTSLFMAAPWPNRWAAVTVTQNQQDSRGFAEKIAVYSQQITETLHSPQIAYAVLAALILAFIVVVFRNLRASRPHVIGIASVSSVSTTTSVNPVDTIAAWLGQRTVGFFVTFMVLIHLMLLLGAVKHMDIRYALSLFLSIPTGLLATSLAALPKKARTVTASLVAAALAALLIVQNPLSKPHDYFTGKLREHVNKSFTEHTNLYPLDESLGPVVEKAATELKKGTNEKPLRLAILSDTLEWDWNLSMRIWPQEFEAHRGVWVEPQILLDTANVCAESAKAESKADLIVRATTTQWEIVPCQKL